MTTSKTGKIATAPILRLFRHSGFVPSDRPAAIGNWLLRYGFALLATAAAMAVYSLLMVYAGLTTPYVTFYPAITVVAAVAGMGPGVVATLLSGLCVGYSVLAPAGAFRISSSGDAVGMAIFLLAGVSISLLARAVQRAQRTAAQQAALLEVADDGIFVRDLESKIRFWNRGAQHTFGWSSQEALGQTSHDLLKTRFPVPLEEIESEVKNKGVWQGELVHQKRNGDFVSLSSRWSLQKDEDGNPKAILEVSRDITERKHAEEMLRKASLYARNLIEARLDPLVTISSAGKITGVNAATEKVTGLKRDQLIGTDFCDYFTEPEKARRGYLQVLDVGFVRNYPLAIRHASGQTTDVLYNATIFKNEQGLVEGVFAAARDVTDRKRAEERVRKLNEELEQRVIARTQELQALNKELEAFNYAVAHDLRAPLRHIHGFAEILADEAKSVLDETAQHHLRLIGDSVQDMEHLLEDLLSLSRLGRQELSKQLCGLQLLVKEVVNTLQPEIKDRDVQWRIGELPFVECDPALMRQVITNLLTNALKFTRPRQQAIIEIGQLLCDGEPVVFVRDNGVGFSMKYADKLFGLFQRLHRQQDFEGTGVGLAIVQRIIHKHGGRIWAEADLNKGATFYFTLQCSSAQPEAHLVTSQVA